MINSNKSVFLDLDDIEDIILYYLNEDNFKYAYEKVRDHLLSGKTYSHLEKLRNV